MKIYINNNQVEAFWNYFAPKGLVSLVNKGYHNGQLYIVAAEDSAVLEEVAHYAAIIND